MSDSWRTDVERQKAWEELTGGTLQTDLDENGKILMELYKGEGHVVEVRKGHRSTLRRGIVEKALGAPMKGPTSYAFCEFV